MPVLSGLPTRRDSFDPTVHDAQPHTARIESSDEHPIIIIRFQKRHCAALLIILIYLTWVLDLYFFCFFVFFLDIYIHIHYELLLFYKTPLSFDGVN